MEKPRERTKDELERLVIEDLDEMIPMVLEMDSREERISSMQDELGDLEERLGVLKSKQRRIAAERAEISANFWVKARKRNKEWIREMNDGGYCVHVAKVKDETSGTTTALRLYAHHSSHDALKHISQIFSQRPPEDDDQDD